MSKIERLKTYLLTNAHTLVSLCLIAIMLASFLPSLGDFERAAINILSISKHFTSRYPSDYSVGVMAGLLLFIFLLWKRGVASFHRHMNTFSARRPRITFVGYVSWLLLLLGALLIVKQSLGLRGFVISCLMLLALGLFNLHQAKMEYRKTAEPSIDPLQFSDEPIESDKQDLLERSPFVDRLYNEIISIPFVDSFVFGLYGEYGDGKTSVIQLLKSRLRGNPNFLVVDFDPWNFRDEAAILPAFYTEIERTISKEFALPGFKRALLKYQKLLAPEISPFGLKLKLGSKDESLEQVKRRIESYIAQTNRKIVIVFDDIDRLQAGEILFVLKLVRLHAKFRNTIFLLSMSRHKVSSLIADKVGGDPDEYIEKIVQKPILLPSIEPKDLEKLLDAHLERLFERVGVAPEQKARFDEKAPYAYQSYIKKLFKNVRQVKTFLNSLGSSLPPVKDEVDLYDFFVLELIRVFNPKVYDDIWRNQWAYIPVEWSDELYLLSPFRLMKGDQKAEHIKRHLEAVIKDERQPDVLRKLVESIFLVAKDALSTRPGGSHGDSSTYRAQKLITHPGSFKKYFTLNVPAAEIPDAYVNSLLREWGATENEDQRESNIAQALLKAQQEGQLRELLTKLLIFETSVTPKVAASIIRAVYRNANLFSQEGTENFRQSEWDNAQRLMMWLINDRVGRAAIQSMLEEVVLHTPHLPFAVRAVGFSCNKSGQGSLYDIYEAADTPVLKRKLSERLEQHYRIDKANILTEYSGSGWKYIFYQWATDWESSSEDNFRVANDYMMELCASDPKNLVLVVDHIVQNAEMNRQTGRSSFNEIKRAYDLGAIRCLAENYRKDDKFTPDGAAVIDQFLVSCVEATEPDLTPS